MSGLRLLVGLLILGVAACAREEPPPGALPDNRPPRVTEIRPESGTVVPEFDGALRIRFNEPIEENRGLQRNLQASPADRFRVEFGFSEIRIRPRGGAWRPDAVYDFRITSPISDILGNRTEDPIRVLFSTGPPVTDTRVEATIRERVTGDPVRGGRAIFYRRTGDSVPYTGVQDTASRFSVEALPPDRYRAWAFRDLNANMRLEKRLEPYDSASFTLDGPDARAELDFRIVEPDSTPPLLVAASARDSLIVELRFDDPLDPAQELGTGRVTVRDTVGDRRWAVDGLGFSAEAVQGGAAAPPGDSAVRVPDGEGARAAPDTAPLPSRILYLRLARALEEGTAYRVRADSVMNLRKLYGGGDTTFVYAPAGDSTPGDSLPPRPGGR